MSSLAGKRLVIFGCGYVGAAVARAALAAGARVEALTRNADKAAALRDAGLGRVAVADLATTSWHGAIAPGADFVVNTVSSGGPENYRRSYVKGMQSILAWAAQGSGPVGTFVYTSSTAVYPQGGGASVDESADASGGTPNGAIIRESEQLLEAAPAFDGSTTTRRGGAPMPDRIISSAKLQRTLGWQPRHADYRVGFEGLLAGERS